MGALGLLSSEELKLQFKKWYPRTDDAASDSEMMKMLIQKYPIRMPGIKIKWESIDFRRFPDLKSLVPPEYHLPDAVADGMADETKESECSGALSPVSSAAIKVRMRSDDDYSSTHFICDTTDFINLHSLCQDNCHLSRWERRLPEWSDIEALDLSICSECCDFLSSDTEFCYSRISPLCPKKCDSDELLYMQPIKCTFYGVEYKLFSQCFTVKDKNGNANVISSFSCLSASYLNALLASGKKFKINGKQHKQIIYVYALQEPPVEKDLVSFLNDLFGSKWFIKVAFPQTSSPTSFIRALGVGVYIFTTSIHSFCVKINEIGQVIRIDSCRARKYKIQHLSRYYLTRKEIVSLIRHQDHCIKVI